MSAISILREAAEIVSDAETTIGLGEFEPDDSITLPDSRAKQFGKHLEKKRLENSPYNPQHNYSRYQAGKNYAQAKDIGRYFWRNYDQFTTVHIVRTADNNDEPLVEQTEALTPDAYTQSRRDLLNRLHADSARLTTIAPKYPTRPNPRVRSHVHEGYWIPGLHEAERFELLRDKHHEKVPGSTSVDIRVEHHSPDESPPIMQGKDKSRGGTSALPHELAGANQPLIDTETDALDLHDQRAIKWFAALSAGSDGSHSTRGMSYFRKCNNAVSYAEAVENGMKRQVYRDLKRVELPHQIQESESTVIPDLDKSGSPHEQIEPRIERQFIDDYCREIGNPSPSVIRENIEDNIDVLKEAQAEQIVSHCRRELSA